MLIKVVDKNSNIYFVAPNLLRGFWIDNENLANVVFKLSDDKLVVQCKNEVFSKMLCRAVEEAMQSDNSDIVDTTMLIEKYRQEVVDEVINDVVKSGHFQNADTAEMTGEVQIDYPKNSKDSVWFFLRDTMHDFKIGLSDIISALKFSEENGYVPALPEPWWNEMRKIYPEIFEDDDVSGRVQSCENSKSSQSEA